MKFNDEKLLFVAGALVFLLTAAAFFKEQKAEWKDYQGEFIEMVSTKLGEDRVDGIQTGIRQIWSPKLNVVDRCTTCHMGIDVPGFEDAPQPYSTHPNLKAWNKTHPFKDYGCTTCHGGQGYAVDTHNAHGLDRHWEYPLLSSSIAKEYGYKNSAALMEVNCNVCHRQDPATTQRMPNINLAKRLVKEKACTSCHVLDGRNGGSVGPELTFVGGKHGEAFDMHSLQGKHAVLNWHFQHFKNPAKISKNSVMPNFGFSDDEARALALLMMSWRETSIPIEYNPNPLREPVDFDSLDSGSAGETSAVSGESIFQSNCIACHTVDGSKRVGPSFKGLFGSTRPLEGGGKAKADENYIRESITNPTAKVVKGFPPAMPPQSLSDAEIDAMIDFIKKL